MREEEDLVSYWERLVDRLVADGTLRTDRVIAAFRSTPRSAFVPPALAREAVTVDAPLPIGRGQTVSQPTTVATMLELTQPAPGDRVLDIGTGSGWQAALLSHCVGPEGFVVTVERHPTLAQTAAERLKNLAAQNTVVALTGDATMGSAPYAPYDVIVSAASSSQIPPAWVEQLAPGGRLLHPITGMGLRLSRKDRRGRLSAEEYPGYVFVPLVPGSAP